VQCTAGYAGGGAYKCTAGAVGAAPTFQGANCVGASERGGALVPASPMAMGCGTETAHGVHWLQLPRSLSLSRRGGRKRTSAWTRTAIHVRRTAARAGTIPCALHSLRTISTLHLPCHGWMARLSVWPGAGLFGVRRNSRRDLGCRIEPRVPGRGGHRCATLCLSACLPVCVCVCVHVCLSDWPFARPRPPLPRDR
jgi:hypothetical protein